MIMKFNGLIGVFIRLIIFALIGFNLTSCNRFDDPHRQTQLEIYYQFPPIITSMDSSNNIGFPDSVYDFKTIVNSVEELFKVIPQNIIDKNPDFLKVDFKVSSLVVVKFRLFYNLNSITSELSFRDDYGYILNLSCKVGGSMNDGLAILSGTVTQKLDSSVSLSFLYSFDFQLPYR